MNRKKLFVTTLTVTVLAFALFASDRISRDDIQNYVPWSIAKLLYPSQHVFIDYESPLKGSHWVYDTGMVDANGVGLLDIFTTNHNWRQQLLLADGQVGYQDVISTWGLDQSREFPGSEISYIQAETNNPGLYIYWYNRHLHIRAYQLKNHKPVSIPLHALTNIEVLVVDIIELSLSLRVPYLYWVRLV